MAIWDKIFGKKAEIPTLPTLESAQSSAIKSNVASFADIAAMAVDVDLFNQTQLEKMIERTLPGASQQIQKNIMSGLRGEIPDDVRRAITQGNAERFAGPLSGSQFSRLNEAKQLGLYSVDRIDRSLASAESWLAGAKAPSFDVTSMFITPQQKYADTTNQFQRNLLQAKMDAAPDPATRGIFDASMSLTGMILSAYGGGAGYQGTYNPESAYGGGGAPGGFGGTSGPGGFYMGGNNWGFGRTATTPGGGGGNWFLGKQPGKG